jgi:hypothetical protein
VNYQRMNEIMAEAFDGIQRIRQTKGREYANDEDTLADFFEVAKEAGVSPLQVWLTYERKHSRAIGAFCREGRTKSESIRDRVLDEIVYHILLLGLIEDLEESEEALSEPHGVAATSDGPVVVSGKTKVTPGVGNVG